MKVVTSGIRYHLRGTAPPVCGGILSDEYGARWRVPQDPRGSEPCRYEDIGAQGLLRSKDRPGRLMSWGGLRTGDEEREGAKYPLRVRTVRFLSAGRNFKSVELPSAMTVSGRNAIKYWLRSSALYPERKRPDRLSYKGRRPDRLFGQRNSAIDLLRET